jgi:transposase-like protein
VGAPPPTRLRVAGRWTYLYRAIDSAGNTIDFLLSPYRDTCAAKSFLQLAIAQAGRIQPRVINVDGHPAYPAAIEDLKRSSELTGAAAVVGHATSITGSSRTTVL